MYKYPQARLFTCSKVARMFSYILRLLALSNLNVSSPVVIVCIFLKKEIYLLRMNQDQDAMPVKFS
jgi:hypothetical protein